MSLSGPGRSIQRPAQKGGDIGGFCIEKAVRKGDAPLDLTIRIGIYPFAPTLVIFYSGRFEAASLATPLQSFDGVRAADPLKRSGVAPS
jgi:hypothetical protein